MYLIPILVLSLIIYANFKKINVYNTFVNGAKGSLELIKNILPFLIAIFVVVELFKASGLALILAEVLSPAFNLVGIPKELIELTLLRPFTGSGSLALLNDIYASYGADSYIGRSASVIMGSSETVFYVASIYFSKTNVKKLGYAIFASLIASLVGAISACLICKIL